MDNNCTLLNEKELDLHSRLRADMGLPSLPKEKLSKVEVIYETIKNYFARITEDFTLKYGDDVNGLYRKITGQDHPSYTEFVNLTGTFYGT